MRKHETEPGTPLTLGAYPTGSGVQFSIFSRHATELHLLLFNTSSDTTPDEAYVLDPYLNKTGDVWHIHIHGLKAGQLYLYRVDGPHEPGKGHRFDFDAWLIDPYAKALSNRIQWFEWKRELMPKCIVVDPAYDWEGDKPLNYPLKDCVIYETHLAGLTRHPSAKVSSPGSYQGVVELIPYFKQLGITSLEFLPVQEFNPHDVFRLNPALGKGLKNYWGYNTVAFFAPAAQYALDTDKGGQVAEFKTMVKALHQAGIEIILDIVFNHTAEGNENGPTYSFRGLDNSIYYILDDNKEGYRNYSGCGNTLNCNHPIVRSLIISCIRYWVLEMHVDGFRFDLGSILGRDSNGLLLSNPPIIEMLAEDPLLRNTKLIAEAWDAAGSYQVGSFHGNRWAEWNDRYRDDIRRFWANEPRMVSALAMRLSGSSDLYSSNGRKPFHSINFITSHDGFTLNDLVSYEKKHNLPNGEENADGNNANFSKNHGVEGPSQSQEIESLRNRIVKNFLTTLLVSAGTPMLLGGDEFRRTQQGNNNAYCQDNEISWYDWSFADTHADVLRFYRELVLFRIRHQVFKRAEFFSGTDANGNGVSDITWLDENGKLTDWSSPRNLLAVLIDGHRTETKAEKDDNDFLLMFNSGNQDIPFLLPMSPCGSLWHLKIDTAGVVDIYPKGESKLLTDQRIYWVSARSVVVLVADLVHDNS